MKSFIQLSKQLGLLRESYENKPLSPFKSDQGRELKVREQWHPQGFPYITRSGDCHPCYSPLGLINMAKKEFKRFNKRNPETFMDLGSGLGGVLICAALQELKGTGVEYNRSYVRAANQFAKDLKFNFKVMYGDILEFVPKKHPDIIYFWRPLAERDAMKTFSDHLFSWVKPGQIIIDFDTAAASCLDLSSERNLQFLDDGTGFTTRRVYQVF